jgi:hypothetical protein
VQRFLDYKLLSVPLACEQWGKCGPYLANSFRIARDPGTIPRDADDRLRRRSLLREADLSCPIGFKCLVRRPEPSTSFVSVALFSQLRVPVDNQGDRFGGRLIDEAIDQESLAIGRNVVSQVGRKHGVRLKQGPNCTYH